MKTHQAFVKAKKAPRPMRNRPFTNARGTGLALAMASMLGLAACTGEPGEATDLSPSAGDPEAQEPGNGPAASDAGITAKVKARLASEPSTRGQGIEVSTEGAVVTLSGRVESAEAARTAEALARQVPDVRRVENRIDLASALDELGDRTAAATQQAGEEISDAVLASRVKAKFAADQRLSAWDIEVDGEGELIRLSGTVASEAERERAIDLARSVDGVAEVEAEQLTVQ